MPIDSSSLCGAALATEAPTPDLLLTKPHGRGERIINNSMWKHIFTQGCYQLFWLFLIIYGADKYIGRYRQPTECTTYSSLDLNYLAVETLSVVGHQTGGTFDVCCSGDDCYTANGGIYLTGQPQTYGPIVSLVPQHIRSLHTASQMLFTPAIPDAIHC